MLLLLLLLLSVKAGKSQSDSCNFPEILKAITANLEKRLEDVNAMLYDLKEANNGECGSNLYITERTKTSTPSTLSQTAVCHPRELSRRN